MLLLSQAPGGAISARRCSTTSPLPPFAKPNPPLFSKTNPTFPSRNHRKAPSLTLANAADGEPGPSSSRPVSAPPFGGDEPVFFGDDDVPLEGVIQIEKQGTSSSPLKAWGKVALLAGGDAFFLLVFSAIGRFSHGFPVLDFDTVRTADPFLAGWFLSAYFLGGYGEDGRGENGRNTAIVAAAKSWAVGIPLGIAIRTATLGRLPQSSFVLVTMGSTALLLIGWRALLHVLLPSEQTKGNDVYRRGNPFELFGLLTSLIRRW